MKFSPDRPYSDRDTAARKLLEITNAVEAVQDGRESPMLALMGDQRTSELRRSL